MVHLLRLTHLGVFAIAALWIGASMAFAQTGSSIAGVVRDSAGLVIPGVTVEASSPALIEKVRVAVTDEQGLYNITDLRSGVYSVTFTLPGFATFKRENIELTSAFTANVNAELKAGAVEELVTVEGGVPTVDIQNVVQRRVVTREVMDAIPTGNKSWAALAILVPGAKVGSNVGGTLSAQASATIHGSRSQESMMLLDGQRYNQGIGTGGARNAFNENDGAVEEVAFETGALSAESEVGGFVHNIIPKEGGNQFKGSFGYNYTNGNFQSSNLSDDQRALGADITADAIEKLWDFNPALGGPIVQDKLWFFTAFRHWGYQRRVAGAFFNQTPTAFTYTPDYSRPGIDYLRKISGNLRLTYMASKKSKITVFYENQIEDGPYWYSNRLHAPEATWIKEQAPNYVTQARWSHPATSRMLFEAGSTFVNNDWHTFPQPSVSRDLPAVRELRTGQVWRNYPGTFGNNASKQYNFNGAVSYVTGTHTFKTGALFLRSHAATTWEVTGGSMNLQLLDGVPNSVVIFATPLSLNEDLNAQVGIYAQDQWKINRLTINMGARFDYYNASIPAQRQSSGLWVPGRDLTTDPVENVPNWKDWMPRLGVAYDLRGDGRTALKATLGKYVFGSEIITYTRAANPAGTISTSATRTWNDANGDFAPQESELGAVSVRDFGNVRALNQRYDPDINNGWGKRGNNWEMSATIQHELMPRLGVSAAYFHRWWDNLTLTRNNALTSSDFDEYCITAPLDARLPGGGGNQICGLYDVKPEKFGQFDNVITFADNYGKQRDSYDGIDLTMNARFPNGATLAGGTNTEQTRSNVCFAQNDPSLTAATLTSVSLLAGRSLDDCDLSLPWQTQFKFYGSYPLPYGFMASATFQSAPGPQINATYTARNAEIAPSLGRNLSSGVNGTTTVQLIPSGEVWGDRLNQIDFRVTKTINLAGMRVQGMFDLYNMLNANPVLAYNAAYGSAWLRPTNVLIGRLVKFGMQVNF